MVPELVPKAAAFSVFREVAKTAIVPREVQMKAISHGGIWSCNLASHSTAVGGLPLEQVAPDEAGESGRFFTCPSGMCL